MDVGGNHPVRRGGGRGSSTRIIQPQARDFQLGSTPGITPVQLASIDFTGLRGFARALMKRGAEEAAENGRQEGLNAQAEAGTSNLVKRDAGFFGFSAGDKAFNEGAKFAFTKLKSDQFTRELNLLANTHINDPKSFEAAVAEKKKELFNGVTSDTAGQLEILFKGQTTGLLTKLRNKAFAQERQRQSDLLSVSFEELNRRFEIETEENGEPSEAAQDEFDKLIEDAENMGVRETLIQGHIVNNDRRTAVSSLVFQFRKTKDKTKFLKDVLDEDGPLKDFSYTERLGVVSKLSALESQAKTERRAIVKGIRAQMTEAIATENRGDRSSNVIAIGAQALIYPELANESIKLAQAVQVRENLDATKKTTISNIEGQIDLLRKREKTIGLTGMESNLLAGVIKIRNEQIKAIEDGDGLEYAQDNGLVQLTHVDANGKLSDQQFRTDNVNLTREKFPNASFYLDSEIDTFKNIWETGQATKRRELLAQIFQQTPQNEVTNVLRQISKKHPGLTFVAAYASGGTEEKKISFDMINGMEFLNSNPDAFDDKKDARVEIQLELIKRGLFDRSGIKTAQIADAVLGLVANEARNNQDDNLKSTYIRKSIARVFGYSDPNSPPEINNQPVIPFTRGLKNEEIENFWNNLTDDSFVNFTGVLPVDLFGATGREITAKEIRESGWPVMTAPGRFAIAMPRANGGVIFLLDRNTKSTFILGYEATKDFLDRVEE